MFCKSQGQSLVVHIPLPGKVFSMSLSRNMLAVATSTRQNLAFDIRRYILRSWTRASWITVSCCTEQYGAAIITTWGTSFLPGVVLAPCKTFDVGLKLQSFISIFSKAFISLLEGCRSCSHDMHSV